MNSFSGFEKNDSLVRIPTSFFLNLLPAISDINELKVTLYCLWRIPLREGNLLYITEEEILRDDIFMSGIQAAPAMRRETLSGALSQAVKRGTLLKARSTTLTGLVNVFFANTERSVKAIEGLERGLWTLEQAPPLPLHIEDKPGIFTLYEENIGPLTPLIADDLIDLSEEFTEELVAEALMIAVKNNARRLAYIEAILKRWQQDGRGQKSDAADDYRRFSSGKYGNEIET